MGSLNEIKVMEREMLTSAIIAPIVECDPQRIRRSPEKPQRSWDSR